MSQYGFLTVERNGGTVTCTLANPPHHTLVAPEVTELRELLAGLESDPAVRVVVFTGAGEGVFIAHYDVGELAASSESQDWRPSPTDPTQLHDLHRLILAMRNSRLITIAAVNGSTVGGGFEFALGCDFRLAQDGPYQLGLPETNLGLIPGAGGTQCYARSLGAARAPGPDYDGADLRIEQALAVEQSQLERCMRSEDAGVALRSYLKNEPWTWKGC